MDEKWLTIEQRDQEVVLTGCSQEANGEIIIPEGVTVIGKAAFGWSNKGITSIIIPESVKKIERQGLHGWINIVIPESVTSICDGAFSDCGSLTVKSGNKFYDSRDNCNAIIETKTNKLVCGCAKTIIPDSVTSIGDSAFYMCDFETITIPENVTRIGNDAFLCCSRLKSISIPKNVRSIGRSAFANCRNLDSIIIPDGVTVIDNEVFSGCYGLASVTLPCRLTNIGERAFSFCRNLKTIIIPQGVINVGDNAFSNSGLASIVIPEGVEIIGEGAFSGCENLSAISIPNTLKKIGDFAFRECKNLQSISVTKSSSNGSDNVQNVDVEGGQDGCVFYKCYNLEKISLPNSWSKILGKLFSTYDSFREYHYKLELSSFNVPKSVMEIENQDWKASIAVLDFNGAIPETNGTFKNCSIETLRVNTTKKNTRIPDDIIEALNSTKNHSIIYAAPESCDKPSQVPGYIKVTQASNVKYDGDLDERDGDLIDINTKYIVSVEPYKLERYHPLTGSLITCAANGIERSYQIIVYESCDMVLQKIDDSLQALSQKVGGVAGLLNQLETLCRPFPNSQG